MACFYRNMRMLLVIFTSFLTSVISAHASDKVTVFAASSLADVMPKLVQIYEIENPDVEVVISFASSGALARQIESGAPADLFISANQNWMNFLIENDAVSHASTTQLLSNRLVIATRKQDVSQNWMALLKNDRFSMGDPVHVPGGAYAKQALEAAGIWPDVRQNAVFSENVRIALRSVTRGELDAAIIYRSDAVLDNDISVNHIFDEASHNKILYPLAVLNGNAPTQSFAQFLSSDDARAIYSQSGFIPVQSNVSSTVQTQDLAEIDTSIWQIIFLSIRVSMLAMIIAVPLAFATAFLLARLNFPGKALLQALIMLPLVMPPVVTGYLLLMLFGKKGELGVFFSNLGIEFAFQWTGAALAAGVMAFPLLVRPMRLSIEAIDEGLEEAARTLGAGWWTRFRTIVLPLALPGVIAGGILGFAKALGEFGATITFVSNIPGETQTLSIAIYSFLQSPSGDNAALTLILISMAIAVLSVLFSEYFASRISAKVRDHA